MSEETGLPEGLDFGNDIVETPSPVVAEVTTDDTTETDLPAASDTDDDSGDASDDDGSADGAADSDAGEDGGEPAGEADPAPAAEKGKKHLVPKERLDQSLRARRAAEQRAQDLETELAALRQEQAAASAPKPMEVGEIQAKMAEANEALLAGDSAKAAALQAEVMATLAAKPAADAPAPAAERDLAAEVEARIEFKQTLAEVYGAYPELAPASELYSEEHAAESVDLQGSYIRRGYSLAEATRKAGEAVAKLHELENRVAPKVAPTPKADPAKRELANKTRDKIAKAVKAPPPMGGTGEPAGDVAFDINNATEEEFFALPESVRNKLLGNDL